MTLRIDRLVAFLGVATLFLPAFRIRTEGMDIYLYYALLPIILTICLAAGSNFVSRALAATLAALLAHSLLSVAVFGNSMSAAAQQLAGIATVSLVFYNIFCVNRFDAVGLFRVYMAFAKAAAAIGIFQVSSYLAGFGPGYDLGWLVMDYYQSYNSFGWPRVQAIFSEPSNFALMLSPAVFVSLQQTLTGKPTHLVGSIWSGLIVAAALLSFSTMAYAAIVFSMCLIGLQRGVFTRGVLVSGAGLAAVTAYSLVPDVRLRVDDTLLTFLYADTLGRNISSLTLYNNWQVALGNLADSYLLGGGLGSHPLAFERHSTFYGLDSVPHWLAALNAQDANSLFLRCLSELGVPGILALSGFLIFRRARAADVDQAAGADHRPLDLAWTVSSASLTFIAMALIRHGHYFALGTPFFLMLYGYASTYARRVPAYRPMQEMAERDPAPPLAEPA